MSGIIEAKEEVEIDNATSDTDDSGTYIEEEVDSDENETESGISSNQESGICSNQPDETTATADTTSTSVGGNIQANQITHIFCYYSKFILEILVKFFIDFIKVTRNVDWPSKVEFDNPKLKDRMGVIISSAAKKYIKNVESTQSEKHGQYTKSRGKLSFDYEYILQTS